MYSKEQSYDMEQQQELLDNNVDTNGVMESGRCNNNGSLGSLGGVRVSGMTGGPVDGLYDGHGVVPSSLAVAQQQQQATNLRYVTLPQMHHQLGLNHVIPGEYMHVTTGYPGGPNSGNHVVSMQNPALISAAINSQAYQTLPPSMSQMQSNSAQTPPQSYDRCPAICSLFAIFCCPITCWCSFPALVYSVCAYSDYRASDMYEYRSKSDVARRLVIIACIIGLILCICWAILTFLYYEPMLALLGDIIRTVQRHLRLAL